MRKATNDLKEVNEKLESKLQQQEAQLVRLERELLIEATLEKVRSRSHAMQHPGELREIIKVVFDALHELNIVIRHEAVSILVFEKGSKDHVQWIADPDQVFPAPFKVEFSNHSMVTDIISARESGSTGYKKIYPIEEKCTYFEYLFEHNLTFSSLPEAVKIMLLEIKEYGYSIAFASNSALSVATHIGKLLSQIEMDTLHRFAQVFDQAYTRFLDLEKAEAQLRESQIQLGLERVRARTMAMHKSEELREAAVLLYKELKALGVSRFLNCGYVEIDEGNNIQYGWMTKTDGTLLEGYTIPLVGDEVLLLRYDAWKKKVPLLYQEVGGDKLRNHTEFTSPYLGSKEVDEMVRNQFTDPTIYYCGNFSHGYLHVITDTLLNAEEESLLIRFSQVFEQTYTRFLDLQKAETQAMEAQIEAALEKVRSSSLAMHHSTELEQVAGSLFDRLAELGLSFDGALIFIFDKEKRNISLWIATNHLSAPVKIDLPYDKEVENNTILKDLWNAIENGEHIINRSYSGEVKNEYFRYVAKYNESKIPESIRQIQIEKENWTGHFAAEKNSLIGFDSWSGHPTKEEDFKILIRFAKVFEQAFTRFLDLQKAEAQAREAKIEAAIERVRSRTMAMQKSDELDETNMLILRQLESLDIPLSGTGIHIGNSDKPESEAWMWDPFTGEMPKVTYNHTHDRLSAKIYEGWKKGESLYVEEVRGEELKEHLEYISTLLPDPATYEDSMPEYVFHIVYFKYGFIVLVTPDHRPTEHSVFIRFAKVFEQTFTRFLDVQKAEAQAREAQIEAALERVRARALAMQKSNDLFAVAEVLWEQLQKLGQAELESSIIHLYSDEQPEFDAWYTYCPPGHSRDEMIMGFAKVSGNSTAWAREVISKYQSPETEYTISASGEKLSEWYRELEKFAPVTIKYGENGNIIVPDILYYHFSKFSGGALLMISIKEPSPDAIDLHKRAASVFDLAYKRFEDLKKAEAQAREANIEAALERVRSRAMAMQRSDELADAAQLLYHEFGKLSINTFTCGYQFIKEEKNIQTAWVVLPDGTLLPNFIDFPLTGDRVLDSRYKDWKEKKPLHIYEVQREVNKEHHRFLSNHVPPFVSEDIFSRIPDRIIFYCANFSDGYLFIISTEFFSQEEEQTIIRFAKVFEITYTRFHDLQKAEANTRLAVRQASLDRVRAEIASMRTPADLQRIIPLVWNELTTLGIPFIRCGVFIIHENEAMVEAYLSTPDGQSLAVLHLPFDVSETTSQTVDSWRRGEVYHQHWNQEDFLNWSRALMNQGHIQSPETYQGAIAPPESLDLHFVPFTQGMLYVGATHLLKDGEIDLVKALAEAFAIAYARYEDFIKLDKAKENIETTLTELKATQAQLIQKEKLASLGELTAGIAHEIQNPLNFVNNYSEVNVELMEELDEELTKGDMNQAQALLADLRDNESKIHHHGQRADAIVRGMLEHARTTPGERQPTDLNRLADEYLRLAYQGLRRSEGCTPGDPAKASDFHCELITDFDPNLGEVEVVAPDIGRVLLNLYNNAFYAVQQKRFLSDQTYTPTVWVSTQRRDKAVEIRVRDNGPGIPEAIREKIFQPFFTTKPTGEGTGLGLSLSYDIVTKGHGGTMEVESVEGEGTTFVVKLPVQNS